MKTARHQNEDVLADSVRFHVTILVTSLLTMGQGAAVLPLPAPNRE
jgi:hypothetical protein